jgi:hypothetical protein
MPEQLESFAIYTGSTFYCYVRASHVDKAMAWARRTGLVWPDAETMNMRNRSGTDRYGYTSYTAPEV